MFGRAKASQMGRPADLERSSLSMREQSQQNTSLDWRDTNVGMLGSDLEKEIKKAAAGGEPQWRDVGKQPGLQVWRIEQFRVVPWPKNKYGQFHEGGTAVVCCRYLQGTYLGTCRYLNQPPTCCPPSDAIRDADEGHCVATPPRGQLRSAPHVQEGPAAPRRDLSRRPNRARSPGMGHLLLDRDPQHCGRVWHSGLQGPGARPSPQRRSHAAPRDPI